MNIPRICYALVMSASILLLFSASAQAQVFVSPQGCPSGLAGCLGGQSYSFQNYYYQYPSNVRYILVPPYRRMYPYVAYTYPVPTCTLTYSYTGRYYYGYYSQAITLSWTSSNATSAYLSAAGGSVPPYGSVSVYPTLSATYTMTVYGPGGTNTCSTTYYQPSTYSYYPYYYNQYPYTYYSAPYLAY